MLKPLFGMSIVIKRIEVNTKSLLNKIVKRETFSDTFPHTSFFKEKISCRKTIFILDDKFHQVLRLKLIF